MQAGHFHHEYLDQTTLHPVAAVAIFACGIAMLALRRQHVVWPIIIMACFVSQAQRIAIATLDFNVMRILVVFGVVRLLFRREYVGFRWQPLDAALVAFVIARAGIMVLRAASLSMFINRSGDAVDSIGMYLLLRCLIRGWDDVRSIVRAFVLVSVPVTACFMVEHATGKNLFAALGGVPWNTIVRDGRLRCQGAFSHPIVAGCFWAAVLPLIAARFGERRAWTVVGVCTSLAIIAMCASSTPVFAVGFAGLGALFYFARRRMRAVRWAAALAILGLHLFMNAPVWHLISRVSAVGGSTAYHRYKIIDNAINHANEWFLLGSSVGTAHWGHQMFDITNQYVLVCLQAGIVAFAAFVVLIGIAFGTVGKLWRAEAARDGPVALSWALGVALAVHCTNFLGISYFGQIVMLWYLHLAIVGSLGSVVRTQVSRQQRHLPAGERITAQGPQPYVPPTLPVGGAPAAAILSPGTGVRSVVATAR